MGITQLKFAQLTVSWPFIFILTLFLTFNLSQAFQFYLQAGETRCFTESSAPNTKVLGEYTVSTGKGKMPVDIHVHMEQNKNRLYSKENVDHGKFAFVIPYEPGSMPKVQHAEMYRKLQEHVRKAADLARAKQDSQGQDNKNAHQQRKLLSVDGDQPHPQSDSKAHEHQHDTSTGHEDGSHYRKRHHYYRDGRDHHKHHGHVKQHGHEDHHEHHDDEEYDEYDEYDYEDELDDFEMDDYDGIDEDEFQENLEDNLKREEKIHGRFEDASDSEKEDRLFDLRKFEICVVSKGEKTGLKRRVRLVINKGEAAHDYTRLAKKEHLTQLEISLRQVSSELHELMRELDRARMMEDILRVQNEGTSKALILFSLISLGTLFSVGGYQAFYTKKFFKRKKIL